MNEPIWRRKTSSPKKKINAKSNSSNKVKLPKNKENEPYPWLFAQDSLEELDTRASFVEYLRWMRSPDEDNKDDTKLEVIQRAVTNASCYKYLEKANKRIKDIVGTEQINQEDLFFEVTCPWRIRVGGHKGPENILLPAFDALGIPYIPSSTLRGIARNQAIRDLRKKKEKEAEQKITSWFGSLDAEKKSDRMGKVIFLDAYPVAKDHESKDGLAMDMVNNIWKWEQGGKQPNYKPNPNLFLSLKQPTFLIGLKKGINCSDDDFINIKKYLIAGLKAGIGSQINSGYGQLSLANSSQSDEPIFQVKFTLRGQLIHGIKKYSENDLIKGKLYKIDRESGELRRNKEGQLLTNAEPEAELRPTAFKSILRYWFRAFALGQLPCDRVKQLEAIIFGAIEPKTTGWLKVQIDQEMTPKEPTNSENGYGEMKGELLLFTSTEIAQEQEENFIALMKSLTWIMFHLGGVGQGARRPCYYRKKDNPPWRGSTLIPDRTEEFWRLPKNVQKFKSKFCRHIELLYEKLALLNNFYETKYQKTPIKLSPRTLTPTNKKQWFDAVDKNCRIIACSDNKVGHKIYPLSILHNKDFKHNEDVCGSINKRSAVWIADLGNYQIVTIFGTNHNPRQKYFSQLKNVKQIFPILDKN